MKTKIFIFVFFIHFLFLAGFAQAVPVGEFTDVKGRVDVTVAGKEAKLANLGDKVNVGDIVRTKSESTAEITLVDENIIRLSPASRLEITEYLVDQEHTKGILNLFRGTVQSIVKGRVFKRGGNNVYEVHTPTAVVGVRGTDFKTFFKNGVSGAVFNENGGYCYNINLPDVVKLIKQGFGMLVFGPEEAPIIVPASDPLLQQFLTGIGFFDSGGFAGTGMPPGFDFTFLFLWQPPTPQFTHNFRDFVFETYHSNQQSHTNGPTNGKHD
jgi:hypothetical protein